MERGVKRGRKERKTMMMMNYVRNDWLVGWLRYYLELLLFPALARSLVDRTLCNAE